MPQFKIGICGVGRFAHSFIRLFKAHPLVSELVLADLIDERVAEAARQFQITRTVGSLEELCRSDVDAVAIFTQRHMHGPQAISALHAGKHVYCAVPAASSLEDLHELVRTVDSTGLIYMTGETSYYYPCTIYCRQRHEQGDLGRFVYGEAQYLHDMDHFYQSFKHSGGEQWKQVAGFPPMYYCTHSTSMILSVTNARVTHVSCMGVQDDHADGIFRPGANLWDNTFSNEIALMRTSDGGAMRINELRRVGWRGPNSVYMSVFGTQGSFEQNALNSCWLTRDQEDLTDLTETLACGSVSRDADMPDTQISTLGEEFFTDVSSVHPVDRLPDTFRGLPNGHFGSHQFLVDDFMRSLASGVHPPCHVWNSANWCAPGLVAHESAKRDGQLLVVPSFGKSDDCIVRLSPES